MKRRVIKGLSEEGRKPPTAAATATPGARLDRITFAPGKMGGQACIRGLRVTVGMILSLVAEGASHEEILKDYPYLELEDIRQSLSYAAWLAREEVIPA